MSVQAIGWVLDHSPAKGTDRLVLLAIANHAGQSPIDGAWESWPGIATIQREAGLDRDRTVTDSLTRLAEAGLLERVVNGAPDARMRGDRRPNLYRVLLTDGVSCGDTRCRWCDGQRGVAGASNGVSPERSTGCREATPKPVVNRQGTVLAPPTAIASKQRERDELWEAVLAATGTRPEDVTDSHRGAIAKAVGDLRKVDATPDEVHVRARRFRTTWPKLTLTANALARHWAEFGAPAPAEADPRGTFLPGTGWVR